MTEDANGSLKAVSRTNKNTCASLSKLVSCISKNIVLAALGAANAGRGLAQVHKYMGERCEYPNNQLTPVEDPEGGQEWVVHG